MKLFFIEWSGKEFGLPGVVREIKKQGHEIAYWSGFHLDEEINRADFLGTIFHEYEDARTGFGSPQVDDAAFPPPGEELLKSLYETESTILIMMNKRFEWMGENQKKHLYYQYVRYWDGILNQIKPEAIIYPSAPHSLYDLVIYGLAKLKGIKNIIFELTAIYDRSIVMNDFTAGSERLRKELGANAGKNFTPDDLAPDIRKYFDSQTQVGGSPTPYVIKSLSSIYSPKNIAKRKISAIWTSWRQGEFLERIGSRLLRLGRGTPQKEYESLQTEPDYSKKYIYFTLHYQPECSTSPLGGVFVDQLLAVEILSQSLPQDWLIYIKEQPFQWKPRGATYFKYRFEGYYKILAKLPNVRLVPIATDTFRLIENAVAVASIAGTAPWEGLFRGKPGIYFGYPWYRDCPGVFRVHDATSCREVVEKIQKGFVPDRQQVINYLYSFQNVCPNLFRAQNVKEITSISFEENIINHVNAIKSELSSANI